MFHNTVHQTKQCISTDQHIIADKYMKLSYGIISAAPPDTTPMAKWDIITGGLAADKFPMAHCNSLTVKLAVTDFGNQMNNYSI